MELFALHVFSHMQFFFVARLIISVGNCVLCIFECVCVFLGHHTAVAFTEQRCWPEVPAC